LLSFTDELTPQRESILHLRIVKDIDLLVSQGSVERPEQSQGILADDLKQRIEYTDGSGQFAYSGGRAGARVGLACRQEPYIYMEFRHGGYQIYWPNVIL